MLISFHINNNKQLEFMAFGSKIDAWVSEIVTTQGVQ